MWVEKNLFDSKSSSLGDCKDAGAMTEGTKEGKHVWSVCTFANAELEVQRPHLCGYSHQAVEI